MNKELLSIDLSNYCSKQCHFCYNHSTREGNTMWTPQEVISFVSSCVREGGIKAVSLGGGEPFEYPGIFEIIGALYPMTYLSVTSNGLPLMGDDVWNHLKTSKPDKIHLTIHNSDNRCEVERILSQLEQIKSLGIKPGVNLLVPCSKLEFCREVYARLRGVLDPEQIILIPQRFSDTPSARELASVAGGQPFQSPSCILKCSIPQNFISVSWDKKVNHCSYAGGKQPLRSLDWDGVVHALSQCDFIPCSKTLS